VNGPGNRPGYARIYGHLKTTIEIDEAKLDRIMQATGIGTMKEAVDWALSEALRIATMNQIVDEPWPAEEARSVMDSGYDLIAIARAALMVKATVVSPDAHFRDVPGLKVIESL